MTLPQNMNPICGEADWQSSDTIVNMRRPTTEMLIVHVKTHRPISPKCSLFKTLTTRCEPRTSLVDMRPRKTAEAVR